MRVSFDIFENWTNREISHFKTGKEQGLFKCHFLSKGLRDCEAERQNPNTAVLITFPVFHHN
jgi:hypothetical protein